MQWYNEAGKKHEAGLENLPQQFLSLISTISKVKVQSPVGRVALLKDLPVWGICAVGTAQEIDRTAQQLSRYCLLTQQRGAGFGQAQLYDAGPQGRAGGCGAGGAEPDHCPATHHFRRVAG